MSQKGFTRDLLNVRYGKLLVIERAENRGYTASHPEGRVYWKCRCDCGNEKVISSNDLNSKRTKSCGCYRREIRFLAPGQAAFNYVWDKYKRDAKACKRIFHLTEQEFRAFISCNCYYCGALPSTIQKAAGGNFVYNGIDRMDNTKGYVLGNVVTACRRCNYLKGPLSPIEFIKACKAVAKQHG